MSFGTRQLFFRVKFIKDIYRCAFKIGLPWLKQEGFGNLEKLLSILCAKCKSFFCRTLLLLSLENQRCLSHSIFTRKTCQFGSKDKNSFLLRLDRWEECLSLKTSNIISLLCPSSWTANLQFYSCYFEIGKRDTKIPRKTIRPLENDSTLDISVYRI